MPNADLETVRLNYRQTGSGPDVVLVHGLGANQAFWGLDLVSALAADFRVSTFDLSGHGYSSIPSSGYRPTDMAQDVKVLLDFLGIREAHLVGHSYGGVVALQFAVTCPHRVTSLTVADSRVRALQPIQPLREDPQWPVLQSVLARHGIAIDPEEPELGICMLEALASAAWDKAREHHAQRCGFVPFGGGTRSARRWLHLLQATSARHDFRLGANFTESQLTRFPWPLLAVYGERSPNRPTGHALTAASGSQRLVLVPGAGHFHPVTRPEVFRHALIGFLRETAALSPCTSRMARSRRPPAPTPA
jgi:pimeloyl-ACP methyl ester carboxylesterase